MDSLSSSLATPARRRFGPATVLVAALLATATSCVPERRSNADNLPNPPPVLNVTLSDYRFDYDAQVPRGRVEFRVRNTGRSAHELVVVILPEQSPSLQDLFAETTAQPAETNAGALRNLAVLPPRQPGGTGTFAADMAPGRYGFLCFIQDADGKQHIDKGMLSEFRVQ